MEYLENKCNNCAFFKNPRTWTDVDLSKKTHGDCKRFPPTTNGHLSYWPKVMSDDWCGEWIPKESE